MAQQILTIRQFPPQPGDVSLGEGFSATLAASTDQAEIRSWGAVFGNFVASAMEVTDVRDLEQVYAVAQAAFTEVRENSEVHSETLETFFQGVVHGSIVATDPNRVIAGGIKE
jgi:hypothetical protein